MAKRQFRDQQALVWDVWEVIPGDFPARTLYDRRSGARAAGAPTGADDRAAMLDPELADGWLCFQSGAERRRFAPIPAQWLELPDGVLRVMLEIASPVLQTADTPTRTAKQD